MRTVDDRHTELSNNGLLDGFWGYVRLLERWQGDGMGRMSSWEGSHR